MDITDDQHLSELEDLALPALRIPIKITGVEVCRLNDDPTVTIDFLTRYSYGDAVRGSAEYLLGVDQKAEVERLVQDHPPGSWHLLTSRCFEFRSSELCTLFPEIIPLDQVLLAKHQHNLDEYFLGGSGGDTPRQRLLPDILRPAVKTLVEISCGTIVADHLLQNIEGFLRADGGSWYSVRCSDTGKDVVALLERALTSFATHHSEQSPFSELLIHIVAPISAELICLVNLDELIRARVGGDCRLFIGTTLGSGPECTVAMLGRSAPLGSSSGLSRKLAGEGIEEHVADDPLMVTKVMILEHHATFAPCNEVHIEALGEGFFGEKVNCEFFVCLPDDPQESRKQAAQLEKDYPVGSWHWVEARVFRIDQDGVTFYDFRTRPVEEGV